MRSRVSQARLALSTWMTRAEFLGEAGGKAGAFGQPFLDDIFVQTSMGCDMILRDRARHTEE